MPSSKSTPKTTVDLVAGPAIAAAADIPEGLFLRSTLSQPYWIDSSDENSFYLVHRIDTLDLCCNYDFYGNPYSEMIVTSRKDHFSSGESIETQLHLQERQHVVIHRVFEWVKECTFFCIDRPIVRRRIYNPSGLLRSELTYSPEGYYRVEIKEEGGKAYLSTEDTFFFLNQSHQNTSSSQQETDSDEESNESA